MGNANYRVFRPGLQYDPLQYGEYNFYRAWHTPSGERAPAHIHSALRETSLTFTDNAGRWFLDRSARPHPVEPILQLWHMSRKLLPDDGSLAVIPNGGTRGTRVVPKQYVEYCVARGCHPDDPAMAVLPKSTTGAAAAAPAPAAVNANDADDDTVDPLRIHVAPVQSSASVTMPYRIVSWVGSGRCGVIALSDSQAGCCVGGTNPGPTEVLRRMLTAPPPPTPVAVQAAAAPAAKPAVNAAGVPTNVLPNPPTVTATAAAAASVAPPPAPAPTTVSSTQLPSLRQAAAHAAAFITPLPAVSPLWQRPASNDMPYWEKEDTQALAAVRARAEELARNDKGTAGAGAGGAGGAAGKRDVVRLTLTMPDKNGATQVPELTDSSDVVYVAYEITKASRTASFTYLTLTTRSGWRCQFRTSPAALDYDRTTGRLVKSVRVPAAYETYDFANGAPLPLPENSPDAMRAAKLVAPAPVEPVKKTTPKKAGNATATATAAAAEEEESSMVKPDVAAASAASRFGGVTYEALVPLPRPTKAAKSEAVMPVEDVTDERLAPPPPVDVSVPLVNVAAPSE